MITKGFYYLLLIRSQSEGEKNAGEKGYQNRLLFAIKFVYFFWEKLKLTEI